MLIRPTFSIVHPSARPDQFCATRDKWIRAASRTADYEYVATFDFPSELTAEQVAPARLVPNYGPRCSNDATNVAAAASIGRILVVISDDIYPCEHWDLDLLSVRELLGSKPCVVQVSTGGTADDRGLLTVQILNRARFDQLGYIFHPSYISMYGDDEFSEHARRDGVLVQARHILFPHEHWSNPGAAGQPTDEVYRKQNDPSRYEYGRRLFMYRAGKDFPKHMPADLMKTKLQVV